MKKIIFIATAFGLLSLSACESVPYQTRAQNYENAMKAQFIGKSSDEIILKLGPPTSRSPLSDGGEVLQYENQPKPSSTVVHGTFELGYGWGGYHRYPGYFGVGAPWGYPFNDEPQRPRTCMNRFVIGADKNVKDFIWKGDGCF